MTLLPEPKMAYVSLGVSGRDSPVNVNGVTMPGDYPVDVQRCTTEADIAAATAANKTIVSLTEYRDLLQGLLDNHGYWLPDREEKAAAELLQAARTETQQRNAAGQALNFEITARLRVLRLDAADSATIMGIAGPIQAMIAAGSFATALTVLTQQVDAVPDAAKSVYDFAHAELTALVAKYDAA